MFFQKSAWSTSLPKGYTNIHFISKAGLPKTLLNTPRGGGGEVLPYMGYIGMSSPKGYGFSVVLLINRVSILAYFGI